jgi:hypothetical protein
MNESANPYESPHVRSESGNADEASPKVRFWYFLGSIILFPTLPKALAWFHTAEPRQRIVEISSVFALLFFVALGSLVLGWSLLLLGHRPSSLLMSSLSFLVAISAPLVGAGGWVYQSSWYWSFLASCAVLTVGAFRLPRRDRAGA